VARFKKQEMKAPFRHKKRKILGFSKVKLPVPKAKLHRHVVASKMRAKEASFTLCPLSPSPRRWSKGSFRSRRFLEQKGPWVMALSLGFNHHFLLNCFPNSSRGRIKKMGRPWGQVVERRKGKRLFTNPSISSFLKREFARTAE
jgi:hypothetical protein